MSRKREGEKPLKVVLPITPFLDMSFQLMFFFVMTFRPQAQEGQIAMFLPAPKGSETSPAPPPNLDEPIEEKKEYTIQVRSNRGAIAEMTFIDTAGESKVGTTPTELYNKLKSIVIPQGSKKPSIKIEAMNDLQYGQLVQLMDVCIKAGFDAVGVAPLVEGAAAPMDG